MNGFTSSLMSELDPIYYNHLKKGNLFLYHTPGQVLLLSATTGNVPTIWNVSSNVLFVPLAIRLTFLSGTTVIGGVLLAETSPAGVAIGADPAPIATFTHVAPKNCLRGPSMKEARNSAMLFAPSVCTFKAAPTVIAASGLNLGAAAPTGTGTYETKIEGGLAFGPGSAMSVTYSVTTSTALFFMTILGLELPLS